MRESERVTAALQENSERLIRESMIDAWAYYTKGKPLKLNVQHSISPTADGGYKVKTSISYGIRVTHGLDTDLASAEVSEKTSRFPSSGGNVAAAA